MTADMLIVLGIVVVAVVLFVSEKLPVDMTAVVVMCILLLTGIISPEEGLSGFSNSATITVAAMFVLSAALKKTGTVSYLGAVSSRVFRFQPWIGLTGTMIVVGALSAFINNTPVIAVFIPILLSVSVDNRISPSRLLMPVSFASMFGGVCTLIGTSTNILVSSIAVQHGLPAFGMFEFSLLGTIFAVTGLLYMTAVGVRLIPDRMGGPELTDKFRMRDYLTDVVLLREAKSVGTRVGESPLVRELDIDILEVVRDGRRMPAGLSEIVLRENDQLRVRCDIKQLQKLKDRLGIRIMSDTVLHDADIRSEELTLMEVVIAPNSNLVGESIRSYRFWNVFGAKALAVRHKGQLLNKGFTDTRLRSGDAILVEARREDDEVIRNDRNFVVVSEIETPRYRRDRIIPALAIIAAVVLTASLGMVPIMVGAIIGSVLAVATGCLSLEEAYGSIEWKVIFLLGGIISLGAALEKTGAAMFLSNQMILLIGWLGPAAVLSALYLLTSLLTGIMSNNATAVLLTPVAIAAATELAVSPRPFLMAVTFAASASFMTPIGYQTNTMIYGVGQYKFSDFLKVGMPLNLIFWGLATFLIPVFFPF